ncbi:MAG: phosphoribosyltransferase, partial [Candidatus Kapaibacterium sp.]
MPDALTIPFGIFIVGWNESDATPALVFRQLTLFMSHDESRLLVNDRVFRPFIGPAEISEMVSSIAARINADFAGDELTVLVILKGSVIFASDLVRCLHMPVRMEFTRASSYGRGMKSSGSITLEGLFTDVTERNVLFIE